MIQGSRIPVKKMPIHVEKIQQTRAVAMGIATTGF